MGVCWVFVGFYLAIEKMEYAQRKQELSDLPTIRLPEGRYFLGICKPAWLRLWEGVYRYKVKHWPEANGTKVNVDSLVRAVYPEVAKNDPAVAMLVQDFMWRVKEERTRLREENSEKRKRKQNGEA